MRRTGIPAKAALSFIAALLTFGLIEMSFRIHIFGLSAFSFDIVDSYSGIGTADLLKASDHPGIIYELKPDLDTYFKSVIFRTNSMGLRDREYGTAKPEGAVRVAVLGDSFSMPAGVAIEKSYHSILEEEFNRQPGDVKHEFINFAVGGYSLRQYAAVLKHRAMGYEPDIIVIGWCPGNDHHVHPERPHDRRYVPKPAANPFFRSFLLEERYRQRAFHGIMPESLMSAEEYTEAQREYIVKYFSKIRAHARQVPVVVAYLAHVYNRSHVEQTRVLKKLAADTGLHFVNLGDPDTFGEDNLSKHMLNPIDAHPNGAAHQIFAERLHEALEELMKRPLIAEASRNTVRGPADP